MIDRRKLSGLDVILVLAVIAVFLVGLYRRTLLISVLALVLAVGLRYWRTPGGD